MPDPDPPVPARERVLAGFAKALAEDAAVAALAEVRRSFDTALPLDEVNHVVVLDGEQQAPNDISGEGQYEATVSVLIFATGSDPAGWATTLNAIHAAVVAAAFAPWPDEDVDDAVQDRREGMLTAPDFTLIRDGGEATPVGLNAEATFDLFFATAENDPYTLIGG